MLRPGDEVGIEQVTLLFTDLKGSTALYESMGDAGAYRLVRQHFAEPITESQTQVARCLNYIHENYAHDFPAEVLAKKVFVSPSYLFRIFRKKKGVTPMHYRNLVRVDKAKLLLLDPKFKMEEVAERVGFKDVKYFARVFKKETGSAPSEFRKRNRPA